PPEKRKVGGSTPPLATSHGPVSPAQHDPCVRSPDRFGDAGGDLLTPPPGVIGFTLQQRPLDPVHPETLRRRHDPEALATQRPLRLPGGRTRNARPVHPRVEGGGRHLTRSRDLAQPVAGPELRGDGRPARGHGSLAPGLPPAEAERVCRRADHEQRDVLSEHGGRGTHLHDVDVHVPPQALGDGVRHVPGVAEHRLVHHQCAHGHHPRIASRLPPASPGVVPADRPSGPVPGEKPGDGRPRRCCASLVDLIWFDPDNPDRRAVASAVALLEATRLVDRPFMAGTTLTMYLASLRHGYDGEPASVALAYDGGGRPVGLLSVYLPRRDNTHLAEVTVHVDPLARRRGVGRALFSRGVDLAVEQGRRVLLVGCVDGTPGMEFLAAMGLERGMDEVLRQLDVASVDWARLDREAEAARPHAKEYELVRMPVPTPEGLLD